MSDSERRLRESLEEILELADYLVAFSGHDQRSDLDKLIRARELLEESK